MTGSDLESAFFETFELGKKYERMEARGHRAKSHRFWAFATLAIGAAFMVLGGDDLIFWAIFSALQLLAYLHDSYLHKQLRVEILKETDRIKQEYRIVIIEDHETEEAEEADPDA